MTQGKHARLRGRRPLWLTVGLLAVVSGALLWGAQGLASAADANTRYLQMNLAGLAYSPGTIDGVWGSKTKAAVEKFQRENCLAVDGVAGAKTKGALSAKVKAVQGKASTPADGIFGKNTIAAVKRYQAAHNLVADGIAGARTMGAMGIRRVETSCSAPPPPPPSGGSCGSGGPNTRVDDPTTSRFITRRMCILYYAAKSTGLTNSVGCWGTRPLATSDHPSGRACDFFFNWKSSADVAKGWRFANWLTAHATQYGIKYVIWQAKSWNASSRTWKPYVSSVYKCGNGGNPANNPTGCHLDHVHVSVHS